ncbi:DUF6531 domain-containing protein [Tepidibacillus marianensis]|uniref:DUF6531 domain-containing protein n=1 Tax=Tepidibacillus marianensis TaxID=3131995 RepID=UPI0030CC677B
MEKGEYFDKKGFFYKIGIYFLILTLFGGSILSGLSYQASAATPEMFSDPLLQDWLPQPGQTPGTKPIGGVNNQGQSEIGVPSLLGRDITQNMPNQIQPEEPVDLPKGDLVLKRDDFILPSYGFPLTIQRLYNSSRKDQLSPFGYGWIFPYQSYIQMYSEFNIAEYRSDGSQVNYTFHKDHENLLVDEYDDDPLIYYPLDQGHYTTDGNETSTLTRISKDEYQVKHTNGTTYIFKGYKAAWREGASPVYGKLIAVKDRNGNQVTLNYDSQGRLYEIKSPDGRIVTFGYNGDLVSSVTDPIGRVTRYNYLNNELRQVTHPDGRIETFTYDNDHRLLSSTDTGTGKKEYVYTGDKVTRVEHENDVVVRYEYSSGKVIAYDGEGAATTYYYNDKNLVTKRVDAYGKEYSYQYDSKDRLLLTNGPVGSITMQYDDRNNLTYYKDASGKETTTIYDPNLNLPLQVKDQYGRIWKNTYDSKGNLLTSEDPLGKSQPIPMILGDSSKQWRTLRIR